MVKIDFSKDIYKLLGCVTEEGDVLPFPEWDILKELDRREKRKLRTSESTKKVRDWMREHPEEVSKLKKGRSVSVPTFIVP